MIIVLGICLLPFFLTSKSVLTAGDFLIGKRNATVEKGFIEKLKYLRAMGLNIVVVFDPLKAERATNKGPTNAARDRYNCVWM